MGYSLGRCLSVLYLHGNLFRCFILHGIEYMEHGQGQLPFHHIISGRFAYLLALGVIENIILYLKTKPDIFTEQTRRFRHFIAGSHRERARLRTSSKEHGRLLADDVEIHLPQKNEDY